MELSTTIPKAVHASLGLALVMASTTPLILLDENLVVIAASSSFCAAFGLDPLKVCGVALADLGAGEWNSRQLQSLLRATVAGGIPIASYEMDLVRAGTPPRHLIVNAHLLDYVSFEARLAVAILDVTEARHAEMIKDAAVHQSQVLMRELQHRVANGLQIIASVLVQSARKIQSDEARACITDAHHRVMSIATLQRQLAATQASKVALRSYFGELCDSIGASMIYDHDKLSIATTVDDSVATSEESVSLGLIVTELIINSIKHGFPDRDASGKIAVEYRSGPTGWSLSVADSGVGMSKDQAVSASGLGTGIVDALAKQLDAIVTVTELHPGTRVTIAHAEPGQATPASDPKPALDQPLNVP